MNELAKRLLRGLERAQTPSAESEASQPLSKGPAVLDISNRWPEAANKA
jgi:hypothetical protein